MVNASRSDSVQSALEWPRAFGEESGRQKTVGWASAHGTEQGLTTEHSKPARGPGDPEETWVR